jgi:hypothetical protein
MLLTVKSKVIASPPRNPHLNGVGDIKRHQILRCLYLDGAFDLSQISLPTSRGSPTSGMIESESISEKWCQGVPHTRYFGFARLLSPSS